MPIPVTFKCIKCRGESDLPHTECIPCETQRYFKNMHQSKRIPSTYFTGNEKKGNERVDNEQRRN